MLDLFVPGETTCRKIAIFLCPANAGWLLLEMFSEPQYRNDLHNPHT